MSLSISLRNLDYQYAKANNTEEIVICCPQCIERVGKEDTEYKLSVNLRLGLYNCYRCGYGGKLKNTNELAFFTEEKDTTFEDIRIRHDNLFKFHESSIDLDQISWPLENKNTPFAYKYVKDRGITEDEIQKYNIRVGKSYIGEDGKRIYRWKGRVIFPFIENGVTTYAVGRSHTGADPKYMNSKGSKSLAVFGIDDVKDEVIICEGIISSIAARRYTGVPSVAILGKFISELQADKLSSRCSKVYLSLDGGVEDKIKQKYIKVLLKKNMEVYDVKLPGDKDPDDLKENYLMYFKEAKRVSLMDSFSLF